MSNILFINHTNNVHGAETILLNVLKNIAKESYNIYILEPTYVSEENSAFHKAAQQYGTIIRLPYKNLGGSALRMMFIFLYNMYAVIKLCRFVKEKQITHIYSNTSVTSIGAVLAKKCEVKHIWHLHEPINEIYGWRKSHDFFYKSLLTYKKNKILFVSKEQKQTWVKHFPFLETADILYNPINQIQPFTKNEERNLTFGYIGSLSMRKNLPTLISAFKKIRAKNENIQLLLTKNSGEYLEMIKKIESQNIGIHTIKNIGRNNLKDFYEKIDVLVLPSFSETWGLVVLEAMSVGIPTIVTKYTGLHEILENERHVLYIDPNDEQSLVNAMSQLLQSDLRRKIAQAGITRIKELNFNTEFCVAIRNCFKNEEN